MKNSPAKCCKTCPFLAENAGKPNPNGWSPTEEFQNDWYTDKTLKGKWELVRKGEVMICHATDPNADEYGGTPGAKGSERACVGAVLVAMLHVEALNRLIESHDKKAFSEYRKLTAKPMSKEGMFAYIFMSGLGRTDFFNGASFPREILEPRRLRSPWRDEILDAANAERRSTDTPALGDNPSLTNSQS